MSGPRIGALFAGYGGLDMAAAEVFGGEMAWYSEIDKGALKILGHRFPDVPNVGSVTEADWSTVEPVDILTGGSPCQDLSHAGRRAGMTEGTRSNLWVAMREAIAQLRPSIVVWENVRGAYSAGADSAVEPCAGCVGDGSGVHLRALGRVLGDLSDLGYDARWHGLRAADVGAPHGRFRVFVVATDAQRGGRDGRSLDAVGGSFGRVAAAGGGEGAGAEAGLRVLPTPSARDWKDHTIRREPHRPDDVDTLAKALTDVPCALLPTPRASDGEKGGPNQRGSSGDLMLPAAVQPERLLPTPRVTQPGYANDGRGGRSLDVEARLLPTPRSAADRTSRSAATRRDSLSAPSLGQAIEISRGELPREFASWDELPASWLPAADEEAERWGDYAAAIARWEHVLGRPAPAPTMTSSKGNPQLSPAFVEWMMGLPAGWITDVPGITRNEALKALGNGVVPQQCSAALRTMLTWGEVAA